jgi:cytochrome b6-f complex iron-sulfur subunit
MERRAYTRRAFLNKLWAMLGSLALLDAIVFLIAFFKPGRTGNADAVSGEIVEAGFVHEFEPDTVTAFVEGKFYLARLEDGGFLAMTRRCSHLGCTVPWVPGERRFTCPCHASAFDIRGDVVNPPAPRALDLHPVSIENQRVRVDTTRQLRRTAFSPDQAVYPDPA